MIDERHKNEYINIDNIKIPIWTYGDNKNPPIIFIHGYLRGFSQYFGDLPIRYLKNNYYIIAFDLPGFGHSKKIDINKIKFIEKVQKEILSGRKVILFGVSYGGLLALKYAYLNPGNVKVLIIAGVPLFSGIFNIYKPLLYIKYTKLLKEFNFLNKSNLSHIKHPVLLYYNKRDYLANIFMGKKLKKMLPNSRLFIAGGLNHSWLLHRIDKSGVLSEIETFLNK
jgi:pimeloyl-ACP methyl ester carboxylesterase